MQLSLKREILSNFFFYFVNLDSSLDILKKKMTFIAIVFWTLWTPKEAVR